MTNDAAARPMCKPRRVLVSSSQSSSSRSSSSSTTSNSVSLPVSPSSHLLPTTMTPPPKAFAATAVTPSLEHAVAFTTPSSQSRLERHRNSSTAKKHLRLLVAGLVIIAALLVTPFRIDASRRRRHRRNSSSSVWSQRGWVNDKEELADIPVSATTVSSPSKLSFSYSSLDRLLQAMFGDNATANKATGTQGPPPPSPPTRDFIYVNCATKVQHSIDFATGDIIDIDNRNGTTTSNAMTPRSLLQCHDLLQRRGALNRAWDDIDGHDAINELVTIIPRSDLFPVLWHKQPQQKQAATATATSTTTTNPTFSLSQLEPMGALHFHFRAQWTASDGDDNAAVPATAVQELGRFATTAIYHDKVPYYALLGRTLGEAFGCQWTIKAAPSFNDTNNDAFADHIRNLQLHGLNASRPFFSCPSWDDKDDRHVGQTTIPRTWTVPHAVLAPVWPIMYQLPKATLGDGAAATGVVAGESIDDIDPITPSVGVFRHAFIEMETGRILLHIPLRRRPDNSSETGHAPPQRHRQVLIQPNSCNWDKYLNNPREYEPFQLRRLRDRTTSVNESRVKKFYDKAIVVTATWTSEYYHATVENVPRLLLIKDFIEALNDTSIPIIVATPYHPTIFVQFYADIWGLAHRLTFVSLYTVVYAKELYIPEPTTCLALQPLMSQAYRNAIHRVVDAKAAATSAKSHPTQPSTTKVAAAVGTAHNSTAPTAGTLWMDDTDDDESDWIVVVRRNKTRYLRNHDDMMTALRTALPHEHWFVFDEGNIDGTFPKLGVPQWMVFARAKLILAPHGAGLSNLMACKVGTHIVELLGNDIDSDLCFLHLALSLGMNYHPLHMMDQRDGKNRTYEADIAHVVDVVNQIVSSPAKTPT